MKYINIYFKTIIVSLLLLTFFPFHSIGNSSFSYSNNSTITLACNDHVNISFDENCQAIITPDMILESPDNTSFEISVADGPYSIDDIDGVLDDNFTIGEDNINQTVTVTILETATGNSCWGTITLEDKAPPVAICVAQEISCAQDVPAIGVGVTAEDNCSNAIIELVDESTNIDGVCDQGIGVVITRTYVAIDAQGNTSETCAQEITVTRVSAVDFPEDISWYCADYANYSNLTEPTEVTCSIDFNGSFLDATAAGQANGGTPDACFESTGSGVPDIATGIYCHLAISNSDDTLSICSGNNTFKIIRTWTVLDWCANALVTFNDENDNGIQDADEEDNIQVIKVVDNVVPSIVFDAEADFMLSANVYANGSSSCLSTDELPLPILSDDCSESISYLVFTEIGEATLTNGTLNIPLPGLGIGLHDVTYRATDNCGNTKEETITIEIVDDLVPVAVCDELTQVALDTEGSAIVSALTFDDGSNDNCGIEYFEVRRMEDACSISGNTSFGESVEFCCADIQFDADGNPIPVPVILQVWDFYENSNTCMVEVLVEDKLSPLKISDDAHDTSINCGNYYDNISAELDLESANAETMEMNGITYFIGEPEILNQFGSVEYEDNCNVNLTNLYTYSINSCGEGDITRKWMAVDNGGLTAPTCEQTIEINNVPNWNASFPIDINTDCEDGATSELDIDDVVLNSNGCELLAVAKEIVRFNIVEDACYEDVYTWTIIDWCTYQVGTVDDPSTILDGILIGHTVVRVSDSTAPEIITNAPTEPLCLDALTDADGDCDGTITLPEATISDCASNIITYNVLELGTGRIHQEVAPGDYTMIITATDDCGNQSTAEYLFSVVDCKAPTPYCIGSVILELMPDGQGGGMGDIWATDFNVGSFDNCTAPEDLVFLISTEDNGVENADSTIMFACGDIFPVNTITIYLYVIDEAGNVDYCETSILIESVPGLCAAPLSEINIAGAMTTESGEGVQNTSIGINSETMSVLTDNTGEYEISVPELEDYTIVPSNDLDYDNGVTTYDLVLIRQHILTTNLLDSPYKMIAADANNSGSITTSDVLALRQLILNPTNGLQSNTSWRFINANYSFPNSMNPWQEVFPEFVSFNNLAEDTFVDFMAIKIGDVNGSATANEFSSSSEERSTGSLIFQMEDKKLIEGETYSIDFSPEERFLLGYQFTLNFDEKKLKFLNVSEKITLKENFGLNYLAEGKITTSFEFGKITEIGTQPLFSLVFKAKANCLLSEVLSVGSQITKSEAYDVNGILDIDLVFNSISKNNVFELYQNTPNPFKEKTLIAFNLPEETFATLTLTDISGKVLREVKGNFEKGQHSIEFKDLDVIGLVFYSLKTSAYSKIRKMVIIE